MFKVHSYSVSSKMFQLFIDINSDIVPAHMDAFRKCFAAFHCLLENRKSVPTKDTGRNCRIV